MAWVGLVGGIGCVTAGPGLVGAVVFASFVCVSLVRAAGWAVAVGPGLVGTAVWLPPGWVGLVGGVGWLTAGPGFVGPAVWVPFV